jgi:hypothetical protein
MLSLTCITSFYLIYRRNIESAHGREVERLRKEYSREDKELIEKCLEAKRIHNLPSESFAQELDKKHQLRGKLIHPHSPHFYIAQVIISRPRFIVYQRLLYCIPIWRSQLWSHFVYNAL